MLTLGHMSLASLVLVGGVSVVSWVCAQPNSIGPVTLALVASSTTSEDALATALQGNHEETVEQLQGQLDKIAVRLDYVRDTVSLLQDTALGGEIGETRVVISHKNELGDGYLLESAQYLLNEGILLQESDKNGRLSSVQSRVLFEGQMDPGTYHITVDIACRSGGFGVFSYVTAYRYNVASKYTLRVHEGRVNKLDIVVYQNSDITLQAGERLSVRLRFRFL